MRKQEKKWSDLSASELRKATRQYDEEFTADVESKPLNVAQKKIHQQARKVGRPKVGKGSAIVSLSVEKTLLARADAYAKRQGLGRSELFIRGLKSLIGAA